MKAFPILVLLLLLNFNSWGQVDSSAPAGQQYRIVLNDGANIFGEIISQDKREVLVRTRDGREFFIPQFEIKQLIPLKKAEFSRSGEYVGEDRFATRYFLTTNGLPMKKGEHYVQWNLYGPDFQFALNDRLAAGIMTSWLGVPLIGNVKYSLMNKGQTQFAVGVLAGTGSWTIPDYGGVLPFASLSFGDRSRNLAISGGYGTIWAGSETNGRALLSVAGMIKLNARVSLVFDSFMLLPSQQYDPSGSQLRSDFIGIFVPGLRWHQSSGRAFQFGFTGVAADGYLIPVPIPMVQWYRSL